MVENPKVFISYSHDSDEHKIWVKKLATDLRQHMGVDIIFDQWDLRIGSDLSLFMEQGLNEAALIICVCSDEYVRKSNAGIGGSGYEKMILTTSLIKNTNINYIIPIMRCNTEKILPVFLGTKLYVDFSNDDDYLDKLGELVSRIYNEDITQKPPLGVNPFSKEVCNKITLKTDLEKTLYHNPEMSGTVSFDFKNNSGIFKIGTGKYEFATHWSECGSNSIYGYRDGVELIGYFSSVHKIPENKEFSSFDFTSRSREVSTGEVLIWMNQNGHFAATLITNISVKSRGSLCNNLSFEYRIYP